jgi:hypothetical protein
MKAFLIFLLSLSMGTLGALAQNASGAIASVDAKAQSLAVAAGSDVRTYRVRPSSEITINGAKAQFPALAAGMHVRITANEPGIASKIVASSLPGGTPETGSGDAAKLTAQLADTKWDWRVEKNKPGTGGITFGKEVGFFNDNPNNKYRWKAVDGKTVEFGEHRFIFNASVTEFECPSFAGRGKRWGRRLP